MPQDNAVTRWLAAGDGGELSPLAPQAGSLGGPNVPIPIDEDLARQRKTFLDVEVGAGQLPWVGIGSTAWDYMQLHGAFGRWNEGKATQEDQALLSAFATDLLREESWGYKFGDITSNLPGFMIEFLTSGGLVNLLKTGGKKAAGKGIRWQVAKAIQEGIEKGIQSKGLQRIATGGLRSGEFMADVGAQTAIMEAGQLAATGLLQGDPTSRAVSDAWRRTMPEFMGLTEDQVGELGMVFDTTQREFMETLPLGIVSSLIETGSEKVGTHLTKLPPFSRVKAAQSSVARWWIRKTGLPGPQGYRKLVRTLQRAGWDGIMEEWAEERVGSIARAMVPGMDESWDEVFPGIEDQSAEIAAFSAMPVLGTAVVGRENAKLKSKAKAAFDAATEMEATAEEVAEYQKARRPSPQPSEPGSARKHVSSAMDALRQEDKEVSEVDWAADETEKGESARRLVERAKRRGVDLFFFSGANRRDAVYPAEGVIGVNWDLVGDKKREAGVFGHEAFHDIGGKNQQLLDELVVTLRKENPQGFGRGEARAKEAGTGAGTLLEEAGAYYVQEQADIIDFFGTDSGKAWLADYYGRRTGFERIIDLARELLSKAGLGKTREAKQIERLAAALGRGVNVPEVRAATVASKAFALAGRRMLAPSMRPTVLDLRPRAQLTAGRQGPDLPGPMPSRETPQEPRSEDLGETPPVARRETSRQRRRREKRERKPLAKERREAERIAAAEAEGRARAGRPKPAPGMTERKRLGARFEAPAVPPGYRRPSNLESPAERAKRRWEEGEDVRFATARESDEAEGNTAVSRKGVSRPLKGHPGFEGSVLHQGAGHLDNPDRGWLERNSGGPVVHYDPTFSPETAAELRLADFNNVVSNYVLNTLAPGARREAIRDAARSLRPDGEYLVSVRGSADDLVDELRREFRKVELVTDSEDLVTARATRPRASKVNRDIRFSSRTMEAWAAKASKRAEEEGIPVEEVLGELDRMRQLGRVLNGEPRLLMPEGKGNPIRENADYIKAVDFNTDCPRRFKYQAQLEEIERRVDRFLTENELLGLAMMMKARGQVAPCLYCYVESGRRSFNQYLVKYESANPSFDGRLYRKYWLAKHRSAEMPKMTLRELQMMVAADNYAGSSKANKLKTYDAYAGQFLNRRYANFISKVNMRAGVRFNSNTDFQVNHVLDYMQAITDLAIIGGMAHAYTKQPEMARIFGRTGMRINQSVFAKEEGGRIVEDSEFGMPWRPAQENRKRYRDVGNIMVVTSDKQLAWALKRPWIDMVIPFHDSGMKKEQMRRLDFANYTGQQLEKWIEPKKHKGEKAPHFAYADHGNNKEKYLELCRQAGVHPRFRKWVDHPGYMKLIADTVRADVPQEVVRPDFNWTAATRVVRKWQREGGYVFERSADRDIVARAARDARSGRLGEMRYATAPVDELGFYSAALEGAMNLKQEGFKANAIRPALQKMPGVTTEELDWLDIESWARTREENLQAAARGTGKKPKKIKKQEIIDFILANGAVIEEHQLDEYGAPAMEESEIDSMAEESRRESYDYYAEEVEREGAWTIRLPHGELYDAAYDTKAQARNATLALARNESEGLDDAEIVSYLSRTMPLYSAELGADMGGEARRKAVDAFVQARAEDYSIEAGEPYKEVVYRVAYNAAVEEDPYTGEAIEFETEDDAANYIEEEVEDLLSYATLEERLEAAGVEKARLRSTEAEYANYTEPGGSSYAELLLYLPKQTEGWVGPHYDQVENVVAHIRVKARTSKAGERVLFIEEIQSDWHQAGRDSGYVSDVENVSELPEGWTWEKTAFYEGVFILLDNKGRHTVQFQPRPDESPEAAAIRRYREFLKTKAVPDAPLKKSWPTIAFRRALRYAASHGFDRVAWTTGKMQVDRYESELTGAAEEITWAHGRRIENHPGYGRPIENGALVEIRMEDGQKFDLEVDLSDREVMNGPSRVVRQKLDSVVGNELANRIVSEKSGTVHEMTIGNRPFKAFYDARMAATAKKHGGVVEKVELDFGKYRPSYETVSSFAITPEMRESAIKRGFPRFATRPRLPIERLYEGFDMPEETTWEGVRRLFQDKELPLLRWENAVRAQGGDISFEESAYQAAERFPGRARWRIKKLKRKHIKPLMDQVVKIVKAGGSIHDVERYLYARHSDERNQVIAQRHPEKFGDVDETPGSGLGSREAADIMAEYESGEMGEVYQDIGERFDNLMRETRRIMLRSGLESAETVAAWERMFQHYIPLKTDYEGVSPYATGSGYSVKNSTAKRAEGRETLADSPLAFAIKDAMEVVVRGERNRVGLFFLNLLRKNADATLWNWDEGEPGQQVNDAGVLAPRKKKDELLNTEFSVRENGKQVVIKLHDEMLARALKNLGSHKSGPLLNVIHKATRVLASLATSYNPEFLISNLLRDLQAAMINLAGEEGKGIAAQVFKDVVSGAAIRGAYRGLKEDAEKYDDEWTRYFIELERAGGKTGWWHMPSIEDIQKDLSSYIDDAMPTRWHRITMVVKKVGDIVDHLNGSIENGVRLAAYRRAREAGVSIERAASLAKNLTVNFNRKGELGDLMNAFYMFSNAAVQGTTRMFQALGHKRVQQIAATIASGSLLLTMMNIMAGGDDDDGENFYAKIPDYIRARNLILMHPDGSGDYWKIPLPYGYSMFHSIGESTAMVLSGMSSPFKGASEIGIAAWESFFPLGSEATPLQVASPTLTDPLAQLYENRKFYGGPIKPEQPAWGPARPESQLYFKSVSAASKAATDFLNQITGGDEVVGGLIDISPEVLDHLAEFVGGGAGAFVKRTLVDVPSKLIAGEEVAKKDIPFIRRFMGEPDDWFTNRKYYENRDAIELLEKRVRNAVEQGDGEKASRIRSEAAGHWALRGRLRATDKRLKEMRRRAALGDRDRERELRDAMDKLQREFNRQFKEAR